MKILLLGEFSNFFRILGSGFEELGNQVTLAANKEVIEKFGVDGKLKYLEIPSSKRKIIRYFKILHFLFFGIKKFYGYDIVLLISPNIFGGLKYGINQNIIKRISKRSKKVFLSACGSHYYIYRIKNKLRYNPYDDKIKYDLNGVNTYENIHYIKNNDEVINIIDGIIPVMYTYAEAYRTNPKLRNTIPLPMNINKIAYKPQIIKEKIKIFHGLSTQGAKGSRYIVEAMKKLKDSYGEYVEINVAKNMPLNKYLKVLEEANIVIDQSLTYEYGMNAIYAMAMGKVVLSGNESECQQEFKRTDIPVINILPSVDDIYNKLEKLVLDKKNLVEIGEKSRLFVEDFHNHVKVAQQYVDTFNSEKGEK